MRSSNDHELKDGREILDHHDGHGLTESIKLVADAAGPGGASHHYQASIKVSKPGATMTANAIDPKDSFSEVPVLEVQFQKGPRNVEGSQPGVVELVLLAIVIDRMRSFDAGEYRCAENTLAMRKAQEAIFWLRARADDRARRKVLGTYNK